MTNWSMWPVCRNTLQSGKPCRRTATTFISAPLIKTFTCGIHKQEWDMRAWHPLVDDNLEQILADMRAFYPPMMDSIENWREAP